MNINIGTDMDTSTVEHNVDKNYPQEQCAWPDERCLKPRPKKRSTPPIHKGHHNATSCPICTYCKEHQYIDTGLSLVDLISDETVIKWISTNEMIGTVREAYVYKKMNSLGPHRALCPLDNIQFDLKNRRYGLVLKRAAGDLDHYIICQSFREIIGTITAEHLLFDILSLLVDMHQIGIVHRDIKPGNILIFPKNNKQEHEPQICLADFGNASISYGLDETVNFTDGVCTIVYAPPEDATGELNDRFDIYCLASTVVHFIMFPDRCEQLGEVSKHLSYISQSLNKPQLADLLALMLQSNPNARPSAITALQSPVFDIFRDDKTITTSTYSTYSDSHRQMETHYSTQQYSSAIGFVISIPQQDNDVTDATLYNHFTVGTLDHLLFRLSQEFQMRPCGRYALFHMYEKSKAKNPFLQRKRRLTKKQGLWAACASAIVACCTESHGFVPDFAAEVVIEYMETHVRGRFKTPIANAFQSHSMLLCSNEILVEYDFMIPLHLVS